MKKLMLIKVLFNIVTAAVFLLAPKVSAADYYVLNFKTSRTLIKVSLFIGPDRVIDRVSQACRPQGHSFVLPDVDTSGNRKSRKAEGLPIFKSSFSKVHPSGLTPFYNDETEDRGAVGGLPIAVSLFELEFEFDSDDEGEPPSPAQPITTQPEAITTHSIQNLKTGRASISAWLERAEMLDDAPLIHIPSNQLNAFVSAFARLVAAEPKEMNTYQPFTRCGSFVCDSAANRLWKYGKFVPFSALFLTAASSTAAFAMGAAGFGAGSLAAGSLFASVSGLFYSHTHFPNQFQVSFTFSSSNFEICILQQIAIMLKYSGGYELVSYSSDDQHGSQTLRFNVRVSDAVDASQLKAWLESHNHQWGSPFQIEVSDLSGPNYYMGEREFRL
ncbi:hypothetical protein [Endozoicomonas sp. 8E]|uniref:hypothetical protein n=1 Tax=Endozoicomonas sp. 8E TaxID=3035692 RepID=UPI002939523F|nr:hypothetical protein [Endozoicomonas sp. 8E]WOG25478.1 hypothetical protein P6910_12885 [Endozoicomonas sp. 8E]